MVQYSLNTLPLGWALKVLDSENTLILLLHWGYPNETNRDALTGHSGVPGFVLVPRNRDAV